MDFPDQDNNIVDYLKFKEEIRKEVEDLLREYAICFNDKTQEVYYDPLKTVQDVFFQEYFEMSADALGVMFTIINLCSSYDTSYLRSLYNSATSNSKARALLFVFIETVRAFMPYLIPYIDILYGTDGEIPQTADLPRNPMEPITKSPRFNDVQILRSRVTPFLQHCLNLYAFDHYDRATNENVYDLNLVPDSAIDELLASTDEYKFVTGQLLDMVLKVRDANELNRIPQLFNLDLADQKTNCVLSSLDEFFGERLGRLRPIFHEGVTTSDFSTSIPKSPWPSGKIKLGFSSSQDVL